ncbi:sensor histidine kinase [Dawidia soli]|uniref:histidine kinase n=1 Tax=Dawidia soli TaxID=2782352 RepID=A0AAP2D9E7_9BACT|nr:HAMP domain-containing sensor histidine kinase [Dawidia soli]MBT1687811.1 HAMP domain-containing histidine kinase [Dawidia soli]
MKIRQRLALRFMIVSALVTGAILIFIYLFTRGFVHADFVDRLTQQSSLEVLHYATPHVRDVMPAGSFNLVNPSVSIYTRDGKTLYSRGEYNIPPTWLTFLQQNDVFNAERGEYTTAGRKHVVNDVLYFVFVSAKDLPGERELTFLRKATVTGWIVSLVLSYLSGVYFSGKALQPVTRVVEEVNQITEDNLGRRLEPDRKDAAVDEIDELILTFNALLGRIERAFVNQRRFVQNASHELKTPLTAIMAEVELALTRQRPPEEYQRTLHVVLQETERLATITQGLLTLARLEEGPKTEMNTLDVSELVDRTLAAFSLHHPERTVIREGKLGSAPLQGNFHLLQTALLNILDNAYKYSSGDISVILSSTDRDVTIVIQDYGIGIPPDDLQRIRVPLFRASNAWSIPGAGLGLSLVDRIVWVHRGTFQIASEEGEGTRCTVRLPLTS